MNSSENDREREGGREAGREGARERERERERERGTTEWARAPAPRCRGADIEVNAWRPVARGVGEKTQQHSSRRSGGGAERVEVVGVGCDPAHERRRAEGQVGRRRGASQEWREKDQHHRRRARRTGEEAVPTGGASASEEGTPTGASRALPTPATGGKVPGGRTKPGVVPSVSNTEKSPSTNFEGLNLTHDSRRTAVSGARLKNSLF